MKYLSSLFFTCLFISSLNAQITAKGNFLMGGSIGFSTASSNVEIEGNSTNVKSESTEVLQLNVAPNIGYFLAENWALGIGLDYTLS